MMQMKFGFDIVLLCEHASCHMPREYERLGLSAEDARRHIAWDIGVAAVAEWLVDADAVDAAILGGVSRLVVDCNRDEHAPGLIPIASDGHAIPGNALDHDGHRVRLERFYFPYHAHLAATLAAARPAMILSLHSFTPALASKSDTRPWQIGILYNEDDRLARIAIPAFAERGLIVGDQLPYSGKLLNHTMNIHAEANSIPYLGVEMRQDGVADAAGQQAMAAHIAHVLRLCVAHLA